MSSQLFPDINVWVALTSERHSHHAMAKQWYEAQPVSETLFFCRQTQLGFFRILTTAAVMQQDTLSQQECWQIFDRWVTTGQVGWADEPRGIEPPLRALTTSTSASPKTWMDAYLTAFAEAAELTLVTFDRALAAKAKGAVLLA
jgi:toxin-antitoxin system PIN domain toxin